MGLRETLKKIFSHEWDKKSQENFQEFKMLLKMLVGHKLESYSYHFNSNHNILYLGFGDFIMEINLEGTEWNKKKEMRVFINPITERISWEDCPFRGTYGK